MTIEWQRYQWLPRERWGIVHPDKPCWWYDPCAVQVHTDGSLHLLSRPNPAYNAQQGCGLVTCETDFLYGAFEVVCRLPIAPMSWPAVWMYPSEQWPPELDIMEGYSNEKGSYRIIKNISDLCYPFAVESNVHLVRTVQDKVSSKRHFNLFQNPENKDIRLIWEWKPESIKIWYNGRLVRDFKPEVARQFDKPMRLIFNNGIRNKKGVGYLSSFIIKSFDYTI